MCILLIHALLCLVNSIVRVVFFGEEDPHSVRVQIFCVSLKNFLRALHLIFMRDEHPCLYCYFRSITKLKVLLKPMKI